jgi:hypothetical protein
MGARVAFAVAALVATAALAACGGSADGDGDGDREGGEAHANNPFYGVISAEPLPGGTELTRLGDGGVGTLRVNLAWGSVQSGPEAPYDWSHYDPVVADAARNGIQVLATVYGSPGWVSATAEIPPQGLSLFNFAEFVRAAVERYGANGSFWSDHLDVPKVPIADWQIWNEPNFSLFWKPAPDPRRYVELLRVFHDAVKAADRNARILLGGLFPTPENDPTMESFMSQLYRLGAASLFDVAALHPYAPAPDDALRWVAELRTLMRRFGDARKPIWITEVGWASGGAPSGLTVGPARQTAYLRRTFEHAASERDRLGIAGVVWYSLADTPGPFWPGHCGLFTVAGSAKPSWRAFTDAAGGTS